MTDEQTCMTAHYGLTVCNPQVAVRLVWHEPTKWEIIQGALREIWFWAVQSALFAGSYTAFLYAAKAVFHGN